MRPETREAILKSCSEAEELLPATLLEGHYSEDLAGFIRVFRKAATQKLKQSDLPNIKRAVSDTFTFISTDQNIIMAHYPNSRDAFWKLMPAANKISAAELNI